MPREKSDLDLPNVHAGGTSGVFNYDAARWEKREHGWLAIPGASYCSYCGSVDPETFVKLCAPIPDSGATRMEVADWKYGWPHKVYIDVPNPNPEALTVMGGRWEATEGDYAPGGAHYRPPGPDEIAEPDLTEEQIEILKRDGSYEAEGFPNPRRYHRFGTRDVSHQKFYAEHLKDLGPERLAEVADLIESRTGVGYKLEDGVLKYRGVRRGL